NPANALARGVADEPSEPVPVELDTTAGVPDTVREQDVCRKQDLVGVHRFSGAPERRSASHAGSHPNRNVDTVGRLGVPGDETELVIRLVVVVAHIGPLSG